MGTIPASAIVSVQPNVLAAGGSALALNGLCLTTNTRVPIGTVPAFASADDVGDYFGADTDEHTAAVKYFNGFENSNVLPGSMLFAQYPESAVAAYLRGGNVSTLSLAQLQAITGDIEIAINGNPYAATSVSLSAATSFSSAAAILEAALAQVDTEFTGAISGTTLTVSAVASGTLKVGQTIAGAGVTSGTTITALGTGTGGVGTYTVDNSQTVASESMTASVDEAAPQVSYDSVSGAFIVESGTTGADSTIEFASSTLATSLKLTEATGAVLSQGAAAASPGTFMDAVRQVTMNWATFFTLFDPDAADVITNKLAFSEWTSDQNNRFAYIPWDTSLAPSTSAPATSSLGYAIQQATYAGSILFGGDGTTDVDFTYAAFIAGYVASIDFEQTNGRTNAAFRRQDGLLATCSDESKADNLISNGYNFYGAYATANDEFIWLYNGQISGDFLWIDSYVNQIWLNNGLQLALMVLLRDARSIPYNAAGRALIEAACADQINAALNNGVIRTGVALSSSQKAQITSAAGVDISNILQTRGWYLQVKDASPSVRAARGSPPCTLWYMDGQSVQKINLTSVNVQ